MLLPIIFEFLRAFYVIPTILKSFSVYTCYFNFNFNFARSKIST